MMKHLSAFGLLVALIGGAYANAELELVRCEAKLEAQTFIFALTIDPVSAYSLGYVWFQVIPSANNDRPLYFRPNTFKATTYEDGGFFMESGTRNDLRTSFLSMRIYKEADPVIAFRKKDHSRYNANFTNLGPPPKCSRTIIARRPENERQACVDFPLDCAVVEKPAK